MDRFEISVVVPIYNVKPWLTECVNSILEQEIDVPFEVLLVDDGSTDGCAEVCDAFAAKDPRVKVIHQENAGLSAARNTGIDAAQGRYYAFVDADDRICPGFLQTLYDACEEHDAYMSLCSLERVQEDGSFYEPREIERPVAEGVFCGKELLQNFFGPGGLTYTVAWNKLYRRAIFAQLRYPEGKLNEDLFLIPEVCLQIQKAVVVPKTLYYYVQRDGSIMNGSKTLRHFDAAEAAQRYWECLVENAAYDALADAARFTMGSVSRVYRQLPLALRKEPRSREMLRMQFEVVDHTRRYCAVPGGLWLQSWLLRHFPQTYSWLRERKG